MGDGEAKEKHKGKAAGKGEGQESALVWCCLRIGIAYRSHQNIDLHARRGSASCIQCCRVNIMP